MKRTGKTCRVLLMPGVIGWMNLFVVCAAEDEAQQPEPVVYTVDKRMVQILKSQFNELKTLQQIRDLLGDPESMDVIGPKTIVRYDWSPMENVAINLREGESKLFLSGVSFRVKSDTKEVIEWSWMHREKHGPGIPYWREQEMRRAAEKGADQTE